MSTGFVRKWQGYLLKGHQRVIGQMVVDIRLQVTEGGEGVGKLGEREMRGEKRGRERREVEMSERK